jgi:hypothetical protein
MLNATELCFVDDVEYAGMKHRKVYFIQPPSYFHGLSSAQILERFDKSALRSCVLSKTIAVAGQNHIHNSFGQNHIHNSFGQNHLHNSFGNSSESQRHFASTSLQSAISKKRETDISAKIMYYIREFFLLSLRSGTTRKRKTSLRRFTRKKWIT